MDFELTPDQEDLQAAVRRQLAGRFTMAQVRALEQMGGVDRQRWAELGQLGVFGLRLDERAGGAGLGMADAMLVYEELGRALVPGPLIASHLSAAIVPGAEAGTTVVGGTERDGQPLLVEHLDALDLLVVVDDDGLWSVDPGVVDAESVSSPLDPLTPLHRVRHLPRGEEVGGPDAAARWRTEGRALTAALLLGIAEATTDAAVAYAKERVQFGKPIGAFQAVKHLLADMLVRAELARASVYAAGVMLDDPEVGDGVRAARVAKLLAGEAALANARCSVQVHGGMGFTWEVDCHLYLKRAWLLDTIFGSVDEQAEELAAVH